MNNKSNSNNKQVQKNKKIIRGKNKMEKDEKKKFPAKSVHAHAHMQPYPFFVPLSSWMRNDAVVNSETNQVCVVVRVVCVNMIHNTSTHKHTQAHTSTHKHTQAYTSTHKHTQAQDHLPSLIFNSKSLFLKPSIDWMSALASEYTRCTWRVSNASL